MTRPKQQNQASGPLRPEDAAELRRNRVPDPAVTALEDEARRVSLLFVVCALSLLLLLSWVLLYAIAGHSAPVVVAMVMFSFFSGIMAAWAIGLYITARARRWLWLTLIVIPFTTLPAGLTYAWRRRMEIEREILAQQL